MIDRVELAVRIAGFALVAVAWVTAAAGAAAAGRRSAGRTSGLARRVPAHIVYLLGAIPYFAICALLWRPLPFGVDGFARIACLVLGAMLGAAGAAMYLGGRRTLGTMYNVSSSLGSELWADHRLVTTGLYAHVRHPMYVGLFLAAAGGLFVYRTWTLVFMALTLAGTVVKARHEERLLAAEFADRWDAYARRVPAWIPRLNPHRVEEVANDRATTTPRT